MNVLYFILLGIFWGGSFLAINLSLKGFSPFLAATLRVLIAIIFCAIYIRHKKIPFPQKKYAVSAILNGTVSLGFPWVLLFWGEQFVEPALCSIINATVPIFTVIFAALILNAKEDRMSWNKWLGVIVGFIGIGVIFVPALTGRSTRSIEGLAAVIGMAIFYGIGIAWLKKISPHMRNLMALFLNCAGALMVLIPFAVVYGFINYAVTGEHLVTSLLALLYLSFFSTFIAFILFFKLVRDVGAAQASAVTYLSPIVSIILDWLFLDRWIGNHALFGALIVFLALRLVHRAGSPLPRG